MNRDIRAMIDIETLATSPDAVVTSIGIAHFGVKVLKAVSWELDYSRDTGEIDPVTLRWWLSQERAVLDRNLLGSEDPATAAREIVECLAGVKEVWANAPTFDCVILRNWFKRLGVACPWRFRQERCMRTMYQLGRDRGVVFPRNNEAKHDAVSDATSQANHLLHLEDALWG